MRSGNGVGLVRVCLGAATTALIELKAIIGLVSTRHYARADFSPVRAPGPRRPRVISPKFRARSRGDDRTRHVRNGILSE